MQARWNTDFKDFEKDIFLWDELMEVQTYESFVVEDKEESDEESRAGLADDSCIGDTGDIPMSIDDKEKISDDVDDSRGTKD